MCGNNCCPDRLAVTDNICGNFNTFGLDPQKTPFTVWQADFSSDISDLFLYGTVQIYYDRGPNEIEFVIERAQGGQSELFKSRIGNTLSVTLSGITAVRIITVGASGKYCITAHYQPPNIIL